MGTKISVIIPILIITGMAMAATAFAEIYKHVDKEGRITYSNTPTKGARKLYLDPAAAQRSPSLRWQLLMVSPRWLAKCSSNGT